MKLQHYAALGLCIIFSFVSCKGNQEQESSDLPKIHGESKPETYAEISVKKGGDWESNKYLGGTFKNVDELILPEEHTDHSGYIRYEGPGWENSQVGYRLYLDWRNAIDIFGKKVDTMVLEHVGHPHSKSYHENAPWGLDILKAGKSLGIGGFGRLMNDSVAHFHDVKNTKVKIVNSAANSKVHINYSDWWTGENVVDLSAILSIFPEDRFTQVNLSTSSDIPGLCTGIVKFEDIPIIQNENTNWGYIATYGNQTLVEGEDNLGMAILYKISEIQKISEGPNDHLVVFKPTQNITYYFLAAWEQEKNGLKTEEEFISDLDTKLERLEQEGDLQYQMIL